MRSPAKRLAVALAALAAIGAAAVPGAVVGQSSAGPPDLTLTSRGETVTATRGSSCWRTDDAVLCVDVGELRVKCSLPVKAGAKLVVRTGIPASSISAYLVKKGGGGRDLRAWREEVNASGSDTWRFRLPRGVKRTAAIDVFGYFAQGDVNTLTGIDTDACREARDAGGAG